MPKKETKIVPEVQALWDDVRQDATIEKYRKQGVWISGSSTEVYPIELGPLDICVQLDGKVKRADYKSFNMRYYKILERAMNAITERHKNVIQYAFLSAQDDSCPATMEFRFYSKFDLRKLN